MCVCGRGRPCNLEIRARLIQGYAMLRKTGGAVGEVGQKERERGTDLM